MSGKFQIKPVGDPEDSHTNVVFRTGEAQEVRLVDPRTFGFVAAHTPDELLDSSIGALGPDALDALPSAAAMADRLVGRKVAIKTMLLDQRFLAGLGNIYADEVLSRAGVRGDRVSRTLSASEVGAIRSAIGPVLKDGLKHGGTSLNDLAYLLPDGRAGQFVRRLRVYGREGEECHSCGTPITRTVLGGRSSFWCPRCQT